MKKVFALSIIVLAALIISGCTCVGTHKAKIEGGTKTTSGLFSFGAIDNGYPMIPFYSKFEVSE
ncbi:MAG: hypothetical protein PF904_18695 [Kiritimatiellae bacterium]|jgi:uncharacterized protein YceK|nr:hypothetical protein [Kiritimatiellia bacterium]